MTIGTASLGSFFVRRFNHTDTKAGWTSFTTAFTTDTSYSIDNIQVSWQETAVENTQVAIADIAVNSSAI